MMKKTAILSIILGIFLISPRLNAGKPRTNLIRMIRCAINPAGSKCQTMLNFQGNGYSQKAKAFADGINKNFKNCMASKTHMQSKRAQKICYHKSAKKAINVLKKNRKLARYLRCHLNQNCRG